MNQEKWQHKFENFQKALLSLEDAITRKNLAEDRVIQAGVIQNFEFTLELMWKIIKNKLEYDGFVVNSPRETIKKAAETKFFLPKDAEIMLQALKLRNELSHTYNYLSQQSISFIKDIFFPKVKKLEQDLKGLEF